MGHISGISQTYLRHISDIFQAYLRHISGISQAYIRHVSKIFNAYLRYILDIFHITFEQGLSDWTQLHPLLHPFNCITFIGTEPNLRDICINTTIKQNFNSILELN